MQCPIETQDVKENLKKRDWAFKNVGYGPANPELPNGAFWNDKANEWQTSLSQAKSMRCGNCSAFIQTPEMMECIRSGIDKETGGRARHARAADNDECSAAGADHPAHNAAWACSAGAWTDLRR